VRPYPAQTFRLHKKSREPSCSPSLSFSPLLCCPPHKHHHPLTNHKPQPPLSLRGPLSLSSRSLLPYPQAPHPSTMLSCKRSRDAMNEDPIPMSPAAGAFVSCASQSQRASSLYDSPLKRPRLIPHRGASSPIIPRSETPFVATPISTRMLLLRQPPAAARLRCSPLQIVPPPLTAPHPSLQRTLIR